MSIVKWDSVAWTLALILGALAVSSVANAGGLSPGMGFIGYDQPFPFIVGRELGGPPLLGWDASPWAFGLQGSVASLPLYFNAHGYGFPMTLGNYRIGLIPSYGPCGPPY